MTQTRTPHKSESESGLKKTTHKVNKTWSWGRTRRLQASPGLWSLSRLMDHALDGWLLHTFSPCPNPQPCGDYQGDYAHPVWNIGSSNGDTPAKEQAQCMQ
jgi:hypothetical protein